MRLEELEALNNLDVLDDEELSDLDKLGNLIFSETDTTSEIIDGFRQYITANGGDLQPLSEYMGASGGLIAESFKCDYDYDCGKLAEPNLISTLILNPEESFGKYLLNSESKEHKYSYELNIPGQVIAELFRNTALDGSNIELGKPFDSKIAVQVYNDHREAIIQYNVNQSINNIIEFYTDIVNQIEAGLSNEEISVSFGPGAAERDARILARRDREAAIASTPRPRPY